MNDRNEIKNGIWPTMITPYTTYNKIDYEALEKMIEWYIEKDSDGLFSVCQSSEMFYLDQDERTSLARFVKEHAKNRVQVIASGHISDSLSDQADELNRMADTGIDALVLITNRLAKVDDPDDIFLKNLEWLLKRIPEYIRLGFYECPYPYKRLLSPYVLEQCTNTGRFFFLKDTSCSIDNISDKLKAVKNSGFKIFNANSATLLDSLKLGVSGYSGVMANFHPDLYSWLFKNHSTLPAEAEQLSNFLSLASLTEHVVYPVCAKYNMSLEGIFMSTVTRVKNHMELTKTHKLGVRQLYAMTEKYRGIINDI